MTSPVYDVHPTVPYARGIIEKMSAKTGRSIEEWASLVNSSGCGTDREKKSWLKREYGLGGTTVMLIVNHAAGRGADDADPERYLALATVWVDKMFSGPKAVLWPIFDCLMTRGRELGPDVRISPRKTMVPLYRKHVFAEVKPATKDRVDLGLALKKFEGAFPSPLIAL